MILNSNSALLDEIPAVLAIWAISLVFDVKTLDPAPKSVTSMVFVFAKSEFLYARKTEYSGFCFLS